MECGYATVFTAYKCLTFHYHILACQPALVRRDVGIQLFSLIMNASLSITASCHVRSGPGVWARVVIDRFDSLDCIRISFFRSGEAFDPSSGRGAAFYKIPT